MALEKNIKLKVTADTKQAEANLANIDKKVGGLTTSFKSLAAGVGVGVGIAFLKNSVDQFIESERVIAKLDNTMKYNTVTLQNYAKELQKTTRFEDDAIINGMALIGLYVKDEATLKRVTKATLDLASAKQMDLGSAFELMSKAVSGNVGMLSRYGIRIEQTKDKTKDMNNALLEINKVMGGSSAAEKDTTYGRVESLKNSFGDMQENIGELITKGLTPLLLKLNSIVEFINENSSKFGTLLKWGSYGLTSLGEGSMVEYTPEQQAWINKNKRTLGQNSGLSSLIGDKNRINNLSSQFKEIENTTKSTVKETEKWAEALRKVSFEINKASSGGLLGRGATGTGTFGIEGLMGAGVGKNGRDNRMKQFVEDNQFFIEQMQSDIQILQGAFNEFWNNTFGEANSLLEKFLQNFANGLFELGSKSLISGILNFFLPGVGTLAGQAMKSQTIVVQLGDQELARAVVKGNREAQRLRISS